MAEQITRERLVEFATLRAANVSRQAEWDTESQITLAYRGNELAGETGEACNIIKKLERERLGIKGSRDSKEHLATELADIVICVDLIAMSLGIDLDTAIRLKFNATSEKVGLMTRLAIFPPTTQEPPGCPTPGAAWDGAERRKGQGERRDLWNLVPRRRRKGPDDRRQPPAEQRSGREVLWNSHVVFTNGTILWDRRRTPGTRADRAEDQRPEIRGLDVLLEKEGDTPIEILPDGSIREIPQQNRSAAANGSGGPHAVSAEKDNPAGSDTAHAADLPERHLLPCPLCGAAPRLVDVAGWEIICGCGLQLCLYNDASREGVSAAWNSRAHLAGDGGVNG